jgi:hypothetical protein
MLRKPARATRGASDLGTGEQGFARSTLEALLAATLTRAFALPTFRAQERAERRMRRVVLLGSAGLDAHYDIASARGTNLARWLTALPPNVLDAAGYREALTRLAREHALQLRWLDESALRRAGAHALSGGGLRQRREGGAASRAPEVPPAAARPPARARRRRAHRARHPVRHRRGEPQDAPLDARHAHRRL